MTATPLHRPAFIVSTTDIEEISGSYPDTDEGFSYGRAIGRAAGLQRIGLHVVRVPPGQRTSLPHAEEKEEEFVYVIEGEIDAWIDGDLYPMKRGDLAAFPAGTGIAHAFLNNGDRDAVLLVGGERSKPDNRYVYPLHPSRNNDHCWTDAPARTLGAHDGVPRRR
jgi:uncharacterized cupin superfamily protein